MPNPIRNDLHTVDESSFPYVFEQNATVELKSSDGLVRCNVYRPKGSGPEQRVPVLVTYGPYGKDTYYGEQVFLPRGGVVNKSQTNMVPTLVSMPNPSPRSTLSTNQHIRRGRLPTRGFGRAKGMLSYAQTSGASASPPGNSTPCPVGPARPSSK